MLSHGPPRPTVSSLPLIPALAGCVYDAVASNSHSPLYGIMLDGIPIYGPKGDGGVAPSNLDECGGHTDATYPFYHYHVPDGYKSPYTVKCLVGCIMHNFSNNMVTQLGLVKTAAQCVKAATQYDYSSLQINWK